MAPLPSLPAQFDKANFQNERQPNRSARRILNGGFNENAISKVDDVYFVSVLVR